MKFTIDPKMLFREISTVGRALSPRPINPILSNFKFELLKDQLTISATENADFWIESKLYIEKGKEGVHLVPGAVIQRIVSSLPSDGPVEMEVEANKLKLKCGASDYELVLPGSPENYPRLPSYQEEKIISLSALTFRDCLKKTIFAAVPVTQDRAAHYTNGVFFSFREKFLDVVATDGHRLALNKLILAETTSDKDFLVPAKVASELQKALPSDEKEFVEVYFKNNQLFFEFGNLVFATSLLDIKFPNYSKVLPKESAVSIAVPRVEVRDALRRMLAICESRNTSPMVKLEVKDGVLKITASVHDVGAGEEKISVEGEKEMVIALNPKYLIDVLDVLETEKVNLNWTKQVNPLMVNVPQSPEFSYILMPIRID